MLGFMASTAEQVIHAGHPLIRHCAAAPANHYNASSINKRKRDDTVSWLDRILNNASRSKDAPTHSTGFFDIEGKPVPLSVDSQKIRAARELIHAAAVRTSSAFGIPPQWVSYEVVTISDDEKAYFQLQVSLRIWDEQLWSQSGAFEQQALKRIREDDVNVARAVRAVLWRILPDAGCPHDELAGATAWKPEAVRARAAAYDRLHNDLIPAPLTMPSVVTGLSASPTEPATSPVQSTGFVETMPVAHSGYTDSQFPATGFAATRPFKPGDELPTTQPTQPGKL